MSGPLSIGRRNWHFAWSGDGSGYARYRRLRVFYGRGPFCAECGRCHWRSCRTPEALGKALAETAVREHARSSAPGATDNA